MPPRAELPARVLEFVRTVAPFAYCDGCLASRLGASVELLRAAVAALAVERTIGRARRVCYGCRQAVELSVLEEGAAHEGV